MRQSTVVLQKEKCWYLQKYVNTNRKVLIKKSISVETLASRRSSNDACGTWASCQLVERSAEVPLQWRSS
jgi:hypothetical protein